MTEENDISARFIVYILQMKNTFGQKSESFCFQVFMSFNRIFQEGKTRIGRNDAIVEQDIFLESFGIESEHCVIKNIDGNVTLHPKEGAACAIHGIEVTDTSRLTHGE